MQRLHQRLERPVAERIEHGALQPGDARGGFGDAVQILLEADLLGRVLHLERGQPAQVRGRPTALAGVGDAVAQQQRLQPVARVALLAHGVVPGPHQVAHGLVRCARNAHGGEVAVARQPRQLQRVAPVGLDPVAWALGDRRGCDHLALGAQRREVTPDHEPAGPGLVDHIQPVAPADQFAQRLVQCRQIPPDAAHMPQLAVSPRLRRGDVDAVLVNVQTHIQSARLLHGPSPCKSATT